MDTSWWLALAAVVALALAAAVADGWARARRRP
ncbi:type II toxin-antitoxin system PemK/MazF family toxin, partial [Streptomyces sp. O3]